MKEIEKVIKDCFYILNMVNNVSRKGSFLERLIARLFDRIGFDTKLNSKEFGFESDVIAKKKGFTIIVEAKQYEGYINLGALIDQWANRAKRTNADRVLLVVTGHKNIPEKYYNLAKSEGIYLWNEETVHNLNDIETKEKLYFEIGKRLEFTEVVEKLEKRAKKIMKIKLISIAVIFLLIVGFMFYSFNQNPEVNNANNQIIEDGLNDNSQTGEITEDNEVTKTSEEELLSFCEVEFKKLGSNAEIFESYYFDNYKSASNWIEVKYPNEGMTINNARFFKEWYLDKAKFPIYILDGEYWESDSLGVKGFRACDETGILKR